MGFNIEVSFKIKTGNSFTKCNNLMLDLIEENEATHHYFVNETVGARKIERSHRIAYINFDCIEKLKSFINEVKKERLFFIDCITKDEVKSTILYASSYYLTHIMTKDGRKMYLENGKQITI